MPSNETYSIMPAGFNGERGCWTIRTKLERILIVTTAITALIIIILAILLGNKSTHEVSQTCSTTICLNEAAKVTQYIDTEIDPCENFYKFACGNFLKRSHGDESFQFINKLQELGKRELLEIYMEKVNTDEHYMIKNAKKIFQACLDENGLEEKNLNSLKNSIAEAGGWPILDGDKWDESKFDWLKSMYKLRKLGYHFSAFLDLTVESEADVYLLKVKLPDVFDYSSLNFNKLDFMVETALEFGATDRKKVESEMMAARDFLIALQLEIHSHYGLGNSTVYTVGKYIQKYGAIDWLQFLNNLTEPVLKIQKNDSVIFPPASTLKSWVDLINKTPKRTQANYLMWIVIETTLQYLPDKYLNNNNAWKKQLSIQEKCLERIHDKFTPNPIDILCDRRYLPIEKKKKLQTFVSNIKLEFVKVLESITGIEEKFKIKLLDKAKMMKVIIGQPEDYFENKILDNIAVDMAKTDDDSFISLVAQANRNKQSFLYSTIRNRSSRLYEKWYIKSGANLPVYNAEDNILFLSTIISENFIFDENTPNYLNYGALGVAIGQQLSILPTVNFAPHLKNLNNNLKCVKNSQSDFNITLDNFLISRVLQQALGAQFSYSAFETNKNNNDDMKLIGIDFTPKQLFWISVSSIFCEPENRYGPIHPSVVSGMFSGFIRNHPQFAKDFKCKKGSKMNPKNICNLL